MIGGEIFAAFLEELSNGMDRRSVMLMIAGPNGAGKTTLWNQVLKPHIGEYIGDRYINADEIEREFHPADHFWQPTTEDSRQAQQEATRRRAAMLTLRAQHQEHFVYETVFSDPGGRKLDELRQGIQNGYFVVMVFIGLADVDLAQQRVSARVERGGHPVPPEKQIERYARVYANGRSAKSFVDLALFLDNTRELQDGMGTHRPVAVCKAGLMLGQHQQMPAWWKDIAA